MSTARNGSTDPHLEAALPQRVCECDRPIPMADEDLGSICSRCGRAARDTGPERPRTPTAPAAGAGRAQEWIVGHGTKAPLTPTTKPPKPLSLTSRAAAVVHDLGEATAADVADKLGVTRDRAGSLLASACVTHAIMRSGLRPSENGGRPFTIFIPLGADGPPAAAEEPPAGDPERVAEDEPAVDHEPSTVAPAEPLPAEPPADADADALEEDLVLAWRQLQVKYVAALIHTIDRGSVGRGDFPPEHVFDRCERLLGLAHHDSTIEPEEARTA